MSPVAIAPTDEPKDVLRMLTADDLVFDRSSPEAKTLVRELQDIRQQALSERIALLFDLLGAGMTPEGKAFWVEQPNPFLSDRRPLDLLWAGRFDDVWAAAESHLWGDFG
jgi:hypothetical protein